MSLLRYLLNNDSAQTYDDNKNHNINEISVEKALGAVAASEFDNQAYVDNGIGFQAILLAYDNKGNNPITTGRQETAGVSEHDVPQRGLLGIAAAALNANALNVTDDGSGLTSAALAALSQVNILNDVRARVWVPNLDADIPQPQIFLEETGPRLIDRELYQVCNIVNEQILQSLPPPGSLVVVDYENRKTREGLTLKHTICTDPNFTRIIISSLVDESIEEASNFFSGLSPQLAFEFADGDAIVSHRVEPSLATNEIMKLAENYDEDDTISNKSQHAPFLALLHVEMLPYVKAFLFKAWNEKKITIKINSSYRSPAEQQELLAEWIAEGKTSPKPTAAGTSYHNYGMAIDFNPTLSSGRTILSSESSSTWVSSGIVSIGESVNLFWGGRFSSNYDPIHFDFRNIVNTSAKGKLLDLSVVQNVAANQVDFSSVV